MNKSHKNKRISIDKAYDIAYFIIIGFFILLLIASTVLFTIFFITGNKSLIVALSILVGTVIIGGAVVTALLIKRNQKTIYEGMFNITRENYNKLINQNNSLSYYDEGTFSSYKDLNDQINLIKNIYSNSILFNSYLKYEEMPLEFLTSDKNLISYNSFVENYKQLILRSLVYRNAFVSIKFNVKDKNVTDDERHEIIKTVIDIFSSNKLLFADNLKNNQLLIFVPNIDSIDHLKEQLDKCYKSTAITRYTSEGYSLLSSRISAVVFPYSDIDKILHNLEYASRQNEQVYIYLPNKNIVKNENMLQMNMNLNLIYNILGKFANIDINNFESKKTQKQFGDIISELSNIYNLNYIYLFAYNNDEQAIVPFYHYEDTEEGKELDVKTVPPSMLKTIAKHIDSDNTYFFSKRSNLSPDIGRFLDVYNINSGFFYVVFDDSGNPNGLIMFCKKDEMNIDSYLREALYVFAYSISNIIHYVNSTANNRLISYRLKNLLKIIDYKAYSVDRRNYKLLSISETLSDAIPTAKVGQYCYEALYGRNKPCQKCPLKTGYKMYDELGGKQYESSLALSVPKQNEKAILLCPVNDDELLLSHERYDRDLLTHSFYSLFEKMSFEFAISNHGYIVLATIDNQMDLLNIMNSESLNEYLRSFLRELTESISQIKDIYFLPTKTFAFIFPNGHRKDIFPLLEKIHDLAKKPYEINKKMCTLELTFLAHSYPFGYQNSNEYIRYVISLWNNYKKNMNDNRIILPETKYIRSASHKVFVNEILEHSLNSSTFTIKLQPLVNKNNRHVESAEMLLRVPETYLGSEMNTFEIINAAAEHNKIVLITQILIDHLGRLYKDYGEILFSRFNIKHLSLNTDYSFFQNLSFINEIKELESKLKLPSGFLRFEIRESEIAKYREEFAHISNELSKNNISIVCDNYTGQNISLSEVKNLGFSGVKIDRSIVASIDSDVSSIDGIMLYLKEAKSLGIDITLVGVETKEQFNALKDSDVDFTVQGYYFYKPLDADELINELIRVNE